MNRVASGRASGLKRCQIKYADVSQLGVRQLGRRNVTKSVDIRMGTLNVGSLTGKEFELADMLVRRKIDILCVQETKWKGSKAKCIAGGYKVFYYGTDRRRNVIGVVVK